MGRNPFCDMCGKGIPLESNIQNIRVGDKLCAEACFNCAQSLKSAIDKKKAEVIKIRNTPVQPQPPQPAEQVEVETVNADQQEAKHSEIDLPEPKNAEE